MPVNYLLSSSQVATHFFSLPPSSKTKKNSAIFWRGALCIICQCKLVIFGGGISPLFFLNINTIVAVKVSLHTWSVQCWRSQWMGKWFQGVHKCGKYSSQDILTCIVFTLERFQCLNFPALPIFQTHSWIYLAFVLQFTSLHYDYQNMCVCLFLKLFFFLLCFSLLCGSYYTCTRTELIAKYVWPALQMFSEKILIF